MGKIAKSLTEAIHRSNLKSGMTVSFHHHLRAGDHVLNMVMDAIAQQGLTNIKVNASALHASHAPLVTHINNHVVSEIETAYMSSEVGKSISQGILETPVIFRTHGNRASSIISGESKIDVAFIAASICDQDGNCSGIYGKSAFGSLSYAMADAEHAGYKIVITDNLSQAPVEHPSIAGNKIDCIVVVDSIGDPAGILSNTTVLTKSPTRLKIARDTVDAMDALGIIQPGMNYQAGAGGISLAVTKYLYDIMKQRHITGGSCIGGITGYMVEMLHENNFHQLLDAQSFDLAAVQSLRDDPHHVEISTAEYASPDIHSAVDNLDAVILGATEIDFDFNVNVHTDSFGQIMGGSGGHTDAAAGSKLTVIVAPALRGRIGAVKEHVTTISTPGKYIDLFISEFGIAVNPRRPELKARLTASGLKLTEIQEQYQMAVRLTGTPRPIEPGAKTVAKVLGRDGKLLDTIRSRNTPL